jgi:CO/xanthine dehydrogenase Mo-binding subunit
VTGRAKFGADLFLPGMLVGKILRSHHPHAIIKSIDTSAAERLPGVKAVVTRDDFPEIKAGTAGGEMTRNAMAREKALYDGHPVAATSELIAKRALKLIKVEYEVLPHVIDPIEAMKPGAPILHEQVCTKRIKGADQPSNVIERLELAMGDVEKGFAEADVIVEREYDAKPMHQGYIEPQSCVATSTEDGQIELWCSAR